METTQRAPDNSIKIALDREELHERLTVPATKRAIEMLRAYGNRPGRDHRVALRVLMRTLTGYILGDQTGRVAFGLGTGLGKTTAVIAWASTLAKLGLPEVGVAIAAFKVEALCEIKRNLIEEGVVEELIGLEHSYKHDPHAARAYLEHGQPLPTGFASEASTTSNYERPILLVTHNQIKATHDVSERAYYRYGDGPRRLLVWDEAFEVSQADAIDTACFDGDLLNFRNFCELGRIRAPRLADLENYLGEVISMIAEKHEEASSTGNPVVTTLPTLDRVDQRAFESTLSRHREVEKLATVVECAGTAIRVLPTKESVFLRYRLVVPRELENVAILDASYPIRRLVRLDPSVRDADDLPEAKTVRLRFSQLKHHSRVIVHHMPGPGGRRAVTNDFEGERAVVHDVVKVLRSVPDMESALVFTFKARAGNTKMPEVLERAIRQAGIDVDHQGRRRVHIETWGNQTSLNSYAHCQHVILAGVLHQDRMRLAASILGQQDNLEVALPDSDITRLQASEVAHAIYQAASRGAMRVVKGGEASRMDLWVICRGRRATRYLKNLMPAARWAPWFGLYHDGKKTAAMAARIAEYLDSRPTNVAQMISCQTLKDILFPSHPKNCRTFNKAVKQALELTDGYWRRPEPNSRSVARMDVHYYGFDVDEEDAECDVSVN